MNIQSYIEKGEDMHSKELLNGLSEFYKVFGDLTRLRILDILLARNNMCVNDIAETLDVSQSAVSHQLKNLTSSNLLKADKRGQRVVYSIAHEHIEIILKYGVEHIKEMIK